jgi:hypothetical protein
MGRIFGAWRESARYRGSSRICENHRRRKNGANSNFNLKFSLSFNFRVAVSNQAQALKLNFKLKFKFKFNFKLKFEFAPFFAGVSHIRDEPRRADPPGALRNGR